MSHYKKILDCLVLISIGMYVSSLFYPVFNFQVGNMVGWHCFIMGLPFSWQMGHFEVFANFFFLASLRLYFTGRFRLAQKFSLIAILLTIQTFTLFKMPSGDGPLLPILGYGVGFYLWFISMVIVLVVSWAKGKFNIKCASLTY